MYVVDSSADEPIMLLDKHIGYDELDGMGIDGALFQRELLTLDGLGKKRIQVWINSPGGSVIDGYSIYSAILNSKTSVDTFCIGIAASISGVIFQAGRKRIMADYGILMYHNPLGGENSDGIEAMRNSICKMISSKSGKSCDEIEGIMNRETFIDATEAVNLGFADEIRDSADYNKKRLSPATVTNSTDKLKGYWRDSNKILNNFFKNKNMSLLKINNKLNLNPEASEESQIDAIDAIINRATKAEGLIVVANKKSDDEKAKKQAELDKMKNDLDEATDNLKKMTDSYNAMKKEKDDADEATKCKDAKNLVAGFVKAGAIKNEATAIAKWEALAKVDLEGTKNILENIPTNKKAVKLETEIDGTAPKRSFQGEMIAIHNKTKIEG